MDICPVILVIFLFFVTGVRAGDYCHSYKSGRTFYCKTGCCGGSHDPDCCWSTGLIVGVAVACFMGLVIIAALLVLCYLKYQQRQANRVTKFRSDEKATGGEAQITTIGMYHADSDDLFYGSKTQQSNPLSPSTYQKPKDISVPGQTPMWGTQPQALPSRLSVKPAEPVTPAFPPPSANPSLAFPPPSGPSVFAVEAAEASQRMRFPASLPPLPPLTRMGTTTATTVPPSRMY